MIRGASAALTSRGNFRLLARQAPPPLLGTPPSLEDTPLSPPASPWGWAGADRAGRGRYPGAPRSDLLGRAEASAENYCAANQVLVRGVFGSFRAVPSKGLLGGFILHWMRFSPQKLNWQAVALAKNRRGLWINPYLRKFSSYCLFVVVLRDSFIFPEKRKPSGLLDRKVKIGHFDLWKLNPVITAEGSDPSSITIALAYFSKSKSIIAHFQ